ncbi:MAG: hypothetical protein ABMA25_24510, partial [Ilumatobacteraceae bacterium]
TRLYGDFTEGDRVKIFPNHAFGYLRVTVERPLRLRWEVTEETVAKLLASKAFAKLRADGDREHDVLAHALQDSLGTVTSSALAMEQELTGSLLLSWSEVGGRLVNMSPPPWPVGCFGSMLGVKPALATQLLGELAVAADDGELVTDKKGELQPDPNLRDNENVPLPAIPVDWAADPTERLATIEYRTAVEDYLRAEVHPYVPDAWADHDKTKVGYEVPLTRHFYKYVPPRPLAEIDAEIKALEVEIQQLLAEVTE